MSATLGRVVGIVNLATALLQVLVIVLVAIGDPLVYAFNRRFPHILNVDLKPFNFVALIFVRDDLDRLS